MYIQAEIKYPDGKCEQRQLDMDNQGHRVLLARSADAAWRKGAIVTTRRIERPVNTH